MIVVFDFAQFVARYPELAGVNPTFAQNCFNEAIFHPPGNNDTVNANIIAKRTALLFALTAHIITLSGGQNTTLGPTIVGRVDQASEGSVSVHADMGAAGGKTNAYYMQTQYGATYWALMRQLRQFRYVAPARQRSVYG